MKKKVHLRLYDFSDAGVEIPRFSLGLLSLFLTSLSKKNLMPFSSDDLVLAIADYVVIEDLTASCAKPTLMDMKMGTSRCAYKCDSAL